jgi:energy-converting hydrogenase Eha subunit A
LAGGIILSVVLAWGALNGSARAQPSFYEAAAQIIPVLILALAVEQLWIRLSFTELVLIMAALVIGETAALISAALAFKHKVKVMTDHKVTYKEEYLVWSKRWLTDELALLVALGLVVGLYAVLRTTLAQPQSQAPSDRQPRKPVTPLPPS